MGRLTIGLKTGGAPLGGRLAAGVALGALVAGGAFAQPLSVDCTLIDGRLPADCVQPNAGTVVSMPTGENTEMEVFQSDLGDEGFSITIDAPEPGAEPVLLEGNEARVNELRRVDRVLEQANVEVRFDGLSVEPRLAVSTADMRRTYPAGAPVTFRTSSNYPAYIRRAELRVADAANPGRVLAVLPVKPNGEVTWTMPGSGTADMVYALRVYDARGRYDETRLLPIARTGSRLADPALDGPIVAPGEGDDLTRRRAIPVTGGAITVYSDSAAPGTSVTVMGETIPVDASGAFVVQRILPPGMRDVQVAVGPQVIERRVEIPAQDWFYVATVDVTLGKEWGDTQGEDDSYSIGRVAGYAKGRTASGYEITAAIDTDERDLDEIFDDLDEREPLNLLRSIRAEDVYLTFGDDSTIVEDAPTSGKLFLRVRKDASELLLGDFKLADEELSLVRSDRTLYGVAGTYESTQQTSHGQPRVRLSGYAASPDRLAQRDVLDVTGGSFYQLSRQGVMNGTATVLVQYRDETSGRIVRQTRLVEGRDYEVNYFQGVVQLTNPISQYSGDGLLSDSPLGRYEADLVVQYEYVPLGVTDIEGESVGLRAEGWITDQVRLGFTAQRESTGLADNTLSGVDLLWRASDNTYLSIEHAESEGPGFGTSTSAVGGFEFDDIASAGQDDLTARATEVEMAADLGELTGGRVTGTLSGYYDKKEEGFVSADYNIGTGQESWGLAADVDLSDRASVIVAHDRFEDDDGASREDTRVGFVYQISQAWAAEMQALNTKREDPDATRDDATGERTDVGLRLTYEPRPDYAAWLFAQATVESSGGLRDNDRYGVGARTRLTDSLSAEMEVSDGTSGTGGYANLTYEPNAGTQYYLGYRLDPERQLESGFSGSDGGTYVLGARSKINEAVTLRAENSYDLYGDRPSLTSAYGVSYTPSDRWVLDGGIIYGEQDRDDGTIIRRGLSLGAHYSEGERLKAGISAEYREDDAEDLPDLDDRHTWGLSAYARYKISENARLLANLDALISESEGAEDEDDYTRDGRYIEANLGYAYRPIDNDRFNMLFRYTYLEDLPGPDQVAVYALDGDEGLRQKSHILSFDASYDLTRQWTLGGKYGYRKAEVESARGSDEFSSNTAHLGVLRLDYHVVHNWDVTAEVRTMRFEEAEITETGGLLGVWRHFGNNVKAGVGYQIGDVDDDLRRIDGRKEGAFFNVIAKF
ncbi:hypothetical protein [Litorisediminicola beolgyonensis]|uniref:Uncharacterized protein n=1 Tax=Litorisediminicola beolgyonensis TaxID=1173614 RepID=A0ABW3ZMR4_9RHOB